MKQWNIQQWLTPVFVLAILITLPLLGFALYTDLKSPIVFDAPMYFASAKGFLHGRPFYVELFETKPPGVFLLMASSLLISGDQDFVNLIKVILTILFPIVFFMAGYMRVGRGEKLQLLLPWALLGLLLTLYIQYGTQRLESEGFGILFACAYIFLFHESRGRMTGLRITLMTITAFLAINIKEPFLLAMFAGAILLAKDIRQFCLGFLLPAAIASAGFIVVLLSVDAFSSYLHIYLPEVLFNRIARASSAPLWFNVTMLRTVVLDFTASPVSLGWLIVLVLWIFYPWARGVGKTSRGMIVASGLTMVSLGTLSHFQFRVASRISQHHFIVPWHDLEFWLALTIVLLLLFVAVTCLLRLFQSDRTYFRFTVLALFAAYVTTFNIALNGLAFHQHVMGIPMYLAMALVLLDARCARKDDGIARFAWVTLSMILLLSTLTISRAYYALNWEQFLSESEEEGRMRQEARQIDAIMDECGMERYIAWRIREFGALTEHDPLTLFYEESHTAGPTMFPEMRARVLDFLTKTPLLIVKDGGQLRRYNDVEFLSYIEEHFTMTPPPCVTTPPRSRYLLFFRRKLS